MIEQKEQSEPCRTMVCVTAQKNCERLIRIGAQASHGGPLSIVHVAPIGSQFLDGNDDAKTLEFLYKIVREYGAEMAVEHNDNPLDAIEAQARRVNAQCIILGASGISDDEPFAKELKLRLRDVRVLIVH